MRAGLMPVIVIVTAAIGTGASRSEEPRLADNTPDGAQLVDLYKAARTVADVEAANGKVKDQVLQAQSVASDLARLHAAKMAVCEDVDASHLDATAAKAKAFSVTLARIDRELIRSLATMRQKLATEHSASTRAKDELNRFTLAALEFDRLSLQTQELAKAIQGVAGNIRTAAASCLPTPIPPLFAGADRPSSRKVSIRRPHLTPRKRSANAARQHVPFFPRF